MVLPSEALDQLKFRRGPVRAGYLRWWELVEDKRKRYAHAIWFHPPTAEEIIAAEAEERNTALTDAMANLYHHRLAFVQWKEYSVLRSESRVRERWYSVSAGRWVQEESGIWRVGSTVVTVAGKPIGSAGRRIGGPALKTFVRNHLAFSSQMFPKIVRTPFIMGVRTWQIVNGELVSPQQRYVWRTVTRAESWSTEDGVLGKAGLHALWFPRKWNWRGDSPPRLSYVAPWVGLAHPVAVGVVRIVGRQYVLGTHGWRSAKAMVLKVWATSPWTELVQRSYPEVEVLPL